MFEIFLFINPLGIYCYDTEKQITQTIKDLRIDACYHFVPIANVGVVQDDIIRRRRDHQKPMGVSSYTLATNETLEIYHAIKLVYGNKKARNFIFNLQQKLNYDSSCYCRDLLQKVMKEERVNYAEIESLLKSNHIKDSIAQDQKLAQQWHVKKTPTTVIFDEDKENDSGILLEGTLDQDTLMNIFSASNPSPAASKTFQLFSTNHLRLI
ncbi:MULTISPECIES: DsbA family protein [Lactobacillus]|uniref:DsbA family protein n=1 Tax=Lactobacillus xujianguonis TaxID=2495899 RepID=A0A437SSR4_9LACO|nr:MULTISPECIES: DsbA family protein [Lactobacillus]RVU69904.1 DsbA family protein [Lactobacillus xujianguonis]RVU72277.1 DsbA family protein [Lactobacillus xujianguonis]